MSFFEKLKKKWGIESNWQIILIMVVFSLAGSTAVVLKPIYFEIFGITPETSTLVRIFVWLACLFPTYQVLLLAYGFILGQFSFFWEKEKKLVNFLLRRK